MKKYIFNFILEDENEMVIVKSNPIEAKSSNEAVLKLLIEDETIKTRKENRYKLIFLEEETK
jgi:hypothetical protein